MCGYFFSATWVATMSRMKSEGPASAGTRVSAGLFSVIIKCRTESNRDLRQCPIPPSAGVRLKVSVTQRRCRLKAAFRAHPERRLQPAGAGVTSPPIITPHQPAWKLEASPHRHHDSGKSGAVQEARRCPDALWKLQVMS